MMFRSVVGKYRIANILYVVIYSDTSSSVRVLSWFQDPRIVKISACSFHLGFSLFFIVMLLKLIKNLISSAIFHMKRQWKKLLYFLSL